MGPSSLKPKEPASSATGDVLSLRNRAIKVSVVRGEITTTFRGKDWKRAVRCIKAGSPGRKFASRPLSSAAAPKLERDAPEKLGRKTWSV